MQGTEREARVAGLSQGRSQSETGQAVAGVASPGSAWVRGGVCGQCLKKAQPGGQRGGGAGV